jgi:glycosyltransferase involved in cell wall biosynthesis
LIAVIIPTRDRPGSLKRCLAALANQTIADELEVVVVDDGSRDRQAVLDVVGEHEFARMESKDHVGPAGARNTGVAIARSEVVCFIDDDCEPERSWAENMANAVFAGRGPVAGNTIQTLNGTPLGTALELVVDAAISADFCFAPSNNLAGPRELFVSIPFDERYPAAAGEDREWCARVAAAGYVLRIEPAATLIHRSEPGLRAFMGQQVRYGRGAFRFRRAGDLRRRLEHPTFYLRLIRRGFHHGMATGSLMLAAQAATALGFVLEWAADRRPVRRPASAGRRNGTPARGEQLRRTSDGG